MKTYLTFLGITLLSFLFHQGFSQEKPKIKKIDGTAQIRWEQDKESKEIAKKRAYEMACINALEKAFGTAMIQGNSLYTKNVNTGNVSQTKIIFNTIGNTQVKGDIVEVLSEKYEEFKETVQNGKTSTDIVDIKCSVLVYAKELTEPKLEIKTFVATSDEILEPKTDFIDGESMYLYFKSPVSGYVSVFVDDTKDAQCILPYQQMPAEYEGGIPVEADKIYVFFSKKATHNTFKTNSKIVVDEIELGAIDQKDLNHIYVVFTKSPQNKPFLNENSGTISQENLNKGYFLPRGLSSKDFMKWRIENLQIRSDIQIESIIVSIEKK